MNLNEVNRQTIGFGGLAAAVETRSGELIRMVRACYDGFLAGEPEFELRASVYGPPRGYEPNAARGSEVEVLAGDGRLMLRSADFEALIDLHAREINTWQPCAVHPIDMCMRVGYAACHDSHRGFLLHASAVLRGGLAYVFYGPAGSGKSTIAELLGGVRLADEAVAIRCADGGFTASGTPYWRGTNVTAPVGGLFALRQAETVSIENRAAELTARSLLESVLAPGAGEDAVSGIARCCAELAASVPAGDLSFSLDRDAVWREVCRYSECGCGS